VGEHRQLLAALLIEHIVNKFAPIYAGEVGRPEASGREKASEPKGAPLS
jgi:hypothetical protein